MRLPSGLHIKIWYTEARQRKGKGNATVCQCSSCIDHDEKRRLRVMPEREEIEKVLGGKSCSSF